MDAAAPHSAHELLTTMTAAVAGGIGLLVLARRANVSAIVALLAGGVALGPVGLGIVRPEGLGDMLQVVVQLAVGIILFEGGLSLDVRGYREAPKVIRRLLTVGVLVTWLASATAIHLLFGHSRSFSLLAASLVIVTGPTVIAPLLKRIRVRTNLHNILHWEGVLIDPIGVFIAILCFEWFEGGRSDVVLTNFALRFASGFGIGIASGYLAYFLLQRRIVPAENANVFSLAWAVLTYGATEAVGHAFDFTEAGLLSVVVAGFVLGIKQPEELKRIRRFKEEMTDLMIGMLFVLLAARLEFDQFFGDRFGWRGFLLVAIVMLVVRPLNVFVCTAGLGLELRERVFLGWVAPRGIVAASMASLFAINLQNRGDVPAPKFVETFTYSVITATVVLQGFTAGPLARLLGVSRPSPRGWTIVGAHPFGRAVARFLKNRGDVPVLMVDLNPKPASEARAEGIPTIQGDALDPALEERHEFQETGHLLALTDNEPLNTLICGHWAERFGADRVFGWFSKETRNRDPRPEAAARASVWASLPKPLLVSAELQRGEASLVETDGPPPEGGGTKTPLAAIVGGKPVLDPPESALREATRVLYLVRRADYLLRSLRPDLVADLDVRDLDELFVALVERVVATVPSLPRERTKTELIEREQVFPTALGRGIALPHAYAPALNSRLCMVARLKRPLDFGAPDGEPVRLVFLLLSPVGDPEGHLATLAEIARLASDADAREAILAAPTPAAALAEIRRLAPLKCG